MSALGHKQTFAAQKAMSALPPESAHLQCTSACPLCADSGPFELSPQPKKLQKPVRDNCTPIAMTINPINRVTMSFRRPPAPLARDPPCATSAITTHITTVATTTATSAVTGSANFACATASVMTPVIVPGLAANRITGPSDRVSAALFFEGSWAWGELPRNMENPIQVRTPPP